MTPNPDSCPSRDRTETTLPTVLYLGGEGRSGSTLLAAMLGQYRGMMPVGEMRGVWQAATTDELCGCGTSFSKCAFWSRVGKLAFGGWAHIDVDRMRFLDSQYARHRRLPYLGFLSLSRRQARELSEYGSALRSLYGAVGHASQSGVIVDSTKDPAYAFLLARFATLDVRLVQLVRDSRGVAYSWGKSTVPRPEYANHCALRGTHMAQRTPSRAALEWNAKNGLFHVFEYLGIPRIVIRYETLLQDPLSSLRRIVGLVDAQHSLIGETSKSVITPNEYKALPHHTLGGNRIRFTRGLVQLRVDDEWRDQMPGRDRFVVSMLTLPLLWAYGYARRGQPV